MVVYYDNDIDQIAFELKNKKILLCPTDTLNALISKNELFLFKIKKRNKNKKIILFIPNLSYVKNINLDFVKLAKCFWPGPLTLVYNNQAYRIPDNKLILDILEKTGPLYATSANISGKKPIENVFEAFKTFQNKEKIIVVNGFSKSKAASTIYNVNSKKIIRKGIISIYEINKCINKK